MIIDELSRLTTYSALSAGFERAAEFLGQPGLLAVPDGKYEIDGAKVYALIMRVQGKKLEESDLEVHDRYMDIQVVLQGEELQGWKPRSACLQPRQQADVNRDCQFFADPPDIWFKLRPGQFSLFFPADAHAPLISPARVHKIVIKVACCSTSVANHSTIGES